MMPEHTITITLPPYLDFLPSEWLMGHSAYKKGSNDNKLSFGSYLLKILLILFPTMMAVQVPPSLGRVFYVYYYCY